MDKPLNHDSPWKDTIDQFTRSFLEVTFPECVFRRKPDTNPI
jgi:hypothetical protein